MQTRFSHAVIAPFLLPVLLAFSLPLQAIEFTDYVLRESFEQGIPSDWTQECVRGHHLWTVEKGDVVYPSGIPDGQARVVLRNDSTHSQMFCTRLITPQMKLAYVVEPILILHHAQQQRTGDFERLKIYYRTSPQGRWVPLKEYTHKIPQWQQDTILLPACTNTYQLAFEAEDMMGHGVVMDDIRVRPMPACTAPSMLRITDLTTNSCVIKWDGSMDTDSFELILATDSLPTITREDPKVVLSATVEDFQFYIPDLHLGHTYYAYLRGYCPNEQTEWSRISFITPSVITLPYIEDFNLPYFASATPAADGWTFSSDADNDNAIPKIPYINQGTTDGNRYLYSIDKTSCLAFTGKAGKENTPLPAHKYAYAAMPRLDGDLTNVELRFWATGASVIGNHIKQAGIIVGVMTDPEVWSTFQPVDTCWIRAQYVFRHCVVDMSKYKGEGRFVTLASCFTDQPNAIFIDHVTLAKTDNHSSPYNVTLSDITDRSFTVHADTHGADSWSVYVATDIINPVSNPAAMPQQIVKVAEHITTPTCTLTWDKRPNSVLYVYTRSEKNGITSDLSPAVPVRMHYLADRYPFDILFEEDEPQYLIDSLAAYRSQVPPSSRGTKVNGYCYTPLCNWHQPILSRTNVTSTSIQGLRDGMLYYDDYTVLPLIKDLDKASISCYIENEVGQANTTFQIGVMSDPEDETTFEVIGSFEPSRTYGEWKRCFVSFRDYHGNGRYPAMRYVDKYNRMGSVIYVDKLSIDTLMDCTEAYGQQVSVTDTEATLTWQAPGMSKWHVTVGKSFSGQTPTMTIYDDIVTEPKLHLSGLKPNSRYYYTVASICGTEDMAASLERFITECPPTTAIPYIEDFEKYDGGNTTGEIPDCWTMPVQQVGSLFQPYIYYFAGTSDLVYAGNKALYFASPEVPTWIALPLFDASVQTLEISFMARSDKSHAGDTIRVGVMSDPNDINTFVEVARYELSAGFQEIITPLSSYRGTGRHIAIVRPINTRIYSIDNINVRPIVSCPKVQNVHCSDIRSDGATITWNQTESNKYQLVILDQNENIDDCLDLQQHIVRNEKLTGNNYIFGGSDVAVQYRYYVYVRNICGDDYGEWSLRHAFQTSCVETPVDEMATQRFTTTQSLDCWSTGIIDGIGQVQVNPTYQCLEMHNQTNSDGAYLIGPNLTFPKGKDIRQYEIQFDAHAGSSAAGAHTLSAGVITNEADRSTAVVTRKIRLDNVSSMTGSDLYGFTEALHYTVRFNRYNGDYNGDMGRRFILITQTGGMLNYAYVDNLSIRPIPDCPCPVEMEVTDVEGKTACIDWEDLGDRYEVAVAYSRIDPNTQPATQTFYTDSSAICLTGLKSNTQHFYYIRTIMGKDTSEWSDARFFKTTCPVTLDLPYTETFDDCMQKQGLGTVIPAYYEAPACWKRYYKGATSSTAPYGAGVDNARYGNSGKGLLMSCLGALDERTVDLMPPLDDTARNVLLSFIYRSIEPAPARALMIGFAAVETPYRDMMASVDWLDTLTIYGDQATKWQVYSLDLSSYQGNKRYPVLCLFDPNGTSNSNLTVYIDNFTIENTPRCMKPELPQYIQATSHSITVTWHDPEGTIWDVRYGIQGTDISYMKGFSCLTDTVTIDSLLPGTYYDIYVRRNCTDAQSIWVGPVTEDTHCLIQPEDAHWSFDDQQLYVIHEQGQMLRYMNTCWHAGSTLRNISSYYPYLVSNANDSHYSLTGSFALQLGGASPTGGWVALPEVNADCDTMQLRFKTRMVSGITDVYNGPEKRYNVTYTSSKYDRCFEIGMIDNPAQPETFENLVTHYEDVLTFTDPVTGDHWSEVTVPLYGTKGKYIALTTGTHYTCAFIDEVFIEPVSPCPAPIHVVFDEERSSNEISYFDWWSNQHEWIVTVEHGDSTVLRDTVTTPHYEAKGLLAHEEYIFRVQSKNGTQVSEPRTLRFSTPCRQINIDNATFDFDNDFESFFINGSKTYLRPGCWATGINGGSDRQNRQYWPQVVPNTTTKIMSHTVDPEHPERGYSLWFTVKSTAIIIGGGSAPPSIFATYAILPKMNFDMQDMSLHFYARLSAENPNTHRFAAATTTYPTDITVGYVTGEDIATFVPVDTLHVDISAGKSTQTYITDRDDKFWNEFLVPLYPYAGKGHRLALVYGSEATAVGDLYIDDMSFVPSGFCATPTALTLDSTYTHRAWISWQGNNVGHYVVELRTEDNQLISTQDVSAQLAGTSSLHHCTLTLPQGATRYGVRVRHACSDGEDSDWTGIHFRSANDIRFAESFNTTGEQLPEGWRFEGGTGKDDISKLWDGKPFGTQSANTFAWHIDHDKLLIPSPHLIAYTSDSTPAPTKLDPANMDRYLYTREACFYYLFTPLIDLTEEQLLPDHIITLNFTLALSSANRDRLGVQPTSPDRVHAADDWFGVAVSVDGGYHWTADRLVRWANDANAEYRYNDIPFRSEGQLYYLDMTRYAGHCIQICFISYSDHTGSNNLIHMDDVQLNRCLVTDHRVSNCRYEDYQDSLFNVDADNFQPSTAEPYRTERLIPAISDGKVSQLHRLQLDLLGDPVQEMYDTICEGRTYDNRGFYLPQSQSGIYRQKYTAASGCDSVLTLHLTTLPAAQATLEASICQGSSYRFASQDLFRSGVYRDTVPAVNSCDSVITLYLTVEKARIGSQQVWLCPGTSVTFAGKTITQGGIYTDTLRTEDGCDSIATLEVRNATAGTRIIRAVRCSGDRYTDDLFHGLSQPGRYEVPRQTEHGCDSTVVLYLYVPGGNNAITATVAQDELPFVVEDDELLAADTPMGTYTVKRTMPCGEVTWTITVGQTTALQDIYRQDVALPRKILRDGHIYILRDGNWFDALGRPATVPR